MNPRAEIMAAVARVQRGLSIKDGSRFLRGVRTATVFKVEPGRISWSEGDSKYRRTKTSFLSRALKRDNTKARVVDAEIST